MDNLKPEYIKVVNNYFDKKKEGLDYTQIRKELRERQIEEADIKIIVQQIDDKILAEELGKVNKNTLKTMQSLGWVFILTGIFFTLRRFTGIFFIG